MKTTSELFDERGRLTIAKREQELKLSEINNQIRLKGRMSREAYEACVNGQNLARQRILAIDRQIQSIRSEIHAASQKEFKESAAAQPTGKALDDSVVPADKLVAVVTRLNSIRTEYEHFAADASRIASMRRMASEFVVRLNGIIREALKKEAGQ